MAAAEVKRIERDIAQQDLEHDQYSEQLSSVVNSLATQPDNEAFIGLKQDIEALLALNREHVEELKQELEAAKAKLPAPAPEKWDRSKHPAFQPGFQRVGSNATPTAEQPQEEAPTTFNVNDTVMARWITGDKAWYPAKITSKTGSDLDPVYIVVFTGYGNYETVRKADIKTKSAKPHDNLPTAVAKPTSTSNVAEGSKTALNKVDPSGKPIKKKKSNKDNEAGRKKWQEFQNTAKSKNWIAKKDGDLITATRKDTGDGFSANKQKGTNRVRHVFGKLDEDL
ncbi:hypothetical protein M501DRAFT_1018008 [Patellaria atrata CBS 101060]|uniref:Tudor domain-containing protein n=1 Tax=Patellaria atrata CBS 101060 TaxID=1346257 RepID=A0A9P4S7Q0_9PEZI|nr:hypothetical protein M501DRAFT_1018008 [Patellaria atrata CBS 101060]